MSEILHVCPNCGLVRSFVDALAEAEALAEALEGVTRTDAISHRDARKVYRAYRARHPKEKETP